MRLNLLGNKILAIDASMWIYQFIRALKDSEGNIVPGAHILGFFRRICKLLALKIKPVFVFDGPPPSLKFATLRQRRDEAVQQSRKLKLLAQRIVRDKILGSGVADVADAASVDAEISFCSSSSVDEIFDLEEDEAATDKRGRRGHRGELQEMMRGFVAERRTLDEVELPGPLCSSVAGERKILIDLGETLEATLRSDASGKSQYRELLRLQQQLMLETRQWAVTHGAGASEAAGDLTDFSRTQTRNFVQNAKLHDLVKSARDRMAREEELKPPPQMDDHGNPVIGPRYIPPENVRKKKKSQHWEFSAFSLTTTNELSREHLLFGPTPSADLHTPPVGRPAPPSGDDEQEDPDVDVAALFGADWAAEVDAVTVPRQDFFFESYRPVVSPLHDKQTNVEATAAARPPGQLPTALPHVQPSESSHPPSSTSERPESEASAVVETLSDAADDDEDHDDDDEEEEEAVEVISSADEESEEGAGLELTGGVEHAEDARSRPEDLAGLEEVLRAELWEKDKTTLQREERQMNDAYTTETTSEDLSEQLARYQDIRELLQAFGIPYLTAPGEAEAQCAVLNALDLVDGVISDDSDTLVFGAKAVFRHLYVSDGGTVQMFLSEGLGFNREQLICLAMLLGCDYTTGVHGVGIVNAAEIVKVYRDFDGLRRLRRWVDGRLVEKPEEVAEPLEEVEIGDENLKKFKIQHTNIRATWSFPPDFPAVEVWNAFATPNVDTSEEPFSWGTLDQYRVADIVSKATGLQDDKILDILKPVLIQYNQVRIQRKITDYFNFDCGPVGEVRSVRLKRALADS
jgi:DNA excision repair protein ERCC-5